MNEKDKKRLEELDSDIEILSGNPKPPVVDPEDSGSQNHNEPKPEVQQPVQPEAVEQPPQVEKNQPTPEVQQPPTTGRRSWKGDFLQLEKRYTLLRQESDRYKFESRNELASLKDKIVLYQDENEKLKEALSKHTASSQPSIASAFSEEDVEILGEGTINSFQTAMSTAVNNAVSPLQAELLQIKKAERDRLKRGAENDKLAARKMFRAQLERLVPDYIAINSNPKFSQWLAQVDPYSGGVRNTFFKHAEHNGDVDRVAQFFVEFRTLTQAPQEALAEHAAPLGNGAGSTAQAIEPQQEAGPKVFTMAFINQFYDDDIAGKYAGREALRDQLDKEIDEALSRPGGVVG